MVSWGGVYLLLPPVQENHQLFTIFVKFEAILPKLHIHDENSIEGNKMFNLETIFHHCTFFDTPCRSGCLNLAISWTINIYTGVLADINPRGYGPRSISASGYGPWSISASGDGLGSMSVAGVGCVGGSISAVTPVYKARHQD